MHADARPRCLGKNKDGAPCNATARPESAYCPWHDPNLQAERAQWRRAGGRGRSNQARAKATLPPALTPAELTAWLGVAFRKTLNGTMEPRVAVAAASVAKALLDIAERSELAARLDRLEAEADDWSA